MGMASGSWLDAYDTASYGNVPSPEQPEGPRPKRRKRAKAKQKTLEHLYADLIKAGQVRIKRNRGRPPEVIWL